MNRAIRYPKKFTCKAWNKFDLTQQDILCCRYDIILTDYKTKKEMVMKILKNFNIKNVNKGITKFNKGMAQFSKVMEAEKPQRTHKKIIYKATRKPKVYQAIIKEQPIKTPNFWSSDKDLAKTTKDLLG
jgi:D-lyxose ketol-isomerase